MRGVRGWSARGGRVQCEGGGRGRSARGESRYCVYSVTSLMLHLSLRNMVRRSIPTPQPASTKIPKKSLFFEKLNSFVEIFVYENNDSC